MNPKNVVLAILATFLLSACATANVTQSAKKLAHPYRLKHIYVLYVHPKRQAELDQFGDERSTRVEGESYIEQKILAGYSLDKIPQAFEKVGISSHIIKIEGTLKQSSSADLHKHFSDQYEGPVLIVKPVATTVRKPASGLKDRYWWTTFKVKVELLDTTSNTPTTVWQAVIVPTTPYFAVLRRLSEAEEIARVLVEKMKTDQVIE